MNAAELGSYVTLRLSAAGLVGRAPSAQDVADAIEKLVARAPEQKLAPDKLLLSGRGVLDDLVSSLGLDEDEWERRTAGDDDPHDAFVTWMQEREQDLRAEADLLRTEVEAARRFGPRVEARTQTKTEIRAANTQSVLDQLVDELSLGGFEKITSVSALAAEISQREDGLLTAHLRQIAEALALPSEAGDSLRELQAAVLARADSVHAVLDRVARACGLKDAWTERDADLNGTDETQALIDVICADRVQSQGAGFRKACTDLLAEFAIPPDESGPAYSVLVAGLRATRQNAVQRALEDAAMLIWPVYQSRAELREDHDFTTPVELAAEVRADVDRRVESAREAALAQVARELEIPCRATIAALVAALQTRLGAARATAAASNDQAVELSHQLSEVNRELEILKNRAESDRIRCKEAEAEVSLYHSQARVARNSVGLPLDAPYHRFIRLIGAMTALYAAVPARGVYPGPEGRELQNQAFDAVRAIYAEGTK